MRTLGTLLSYVAGIAALVGAVVLAVVFFTPVALTTQQAAPEQKLSSSPRIAAWQERIAEEKLYAERAAVRDAEEKAKWAALSKPQMTPQTAVNEPRSRELEERASARARQTQREAMARAQREFARQSAENPFAYAATAYAPTSAPAPNRARTNYIFSTMREARGGN